MVTKTTAAKTNTAKNEGWMMSKETFMLVVIVLLVANLAANVLILNNTKSMSSIEQFEITRSGWEENYNLLNEIYKNENYAAQQKEQLTSTLARLQGQAPAPTPTAENNAPVQTSISAEQITTALEWAYIMWNESAKYVVLEYSDFLCPFCQRQYSEGTIEKLVEAYPADVKMAFIPNTRGNPNSLKIAVWAECAGEQGKFNEFIGGIFNAGPAISNMEAVATELSLNIDTFNTCVSEDKYADKVNKKMAEGQNMFAVRGTPGNVILNTETGEFKLISGAYPFDEFERTLKELMAK